MSAPVPELFAKNVPCESSTRSIHRMECCCRSTRSCIPPSTHTLSSSFSLPIRRKLSNLFIVHTRTRSTPIPCHSMILRFRMHTSHLFSPCLRCVIQHCSRRPHCHCHSRHHPPPLFFCCWILKNSLSLSCWILRGPPNPNSGVAGF